MKIWKSEIKKRLNRGERSENYLIHICRLSLNIESLEEIEKEREFLASTMSFIDCSSLSTAVKVTVLAESASCSFFYLLKTFYTIRQSTDESGSFHFFLP